MQAAATTEEISRGTPRLRIPTLRRPTLGVLFPLVAFAISRIVVAMANAVGIQISNEYSFPKVFHKTWDSPYYLEIANDGYLTTPETGLPTNHVAFFPGYPLLVRFVTDTTPLSDLGAALVISLSSGAVATVLIWSLSKRMFDQKRADQIALLFAFFPGSFVLSLAYSESLATLLAIASLYSAHVRRWLLAGIFAAAATATRPNAMAIVAALAVASFLAIRKDRAWRSLIAPALAPLGFLAYMAYLRSNYGSWTIWTDMQKQFGQKIDIAAPFHWLDLAIKTGFTDLNATMVVICMTFVILTAVFVAVRQPKLPAFLWTFPIIVIGSAFFSPALTPKLRFILFAFPFIMAFGASLREREFQLFFGLSVGMLACLSAFLIVSTGLVP